MRINKILELKEVLGDPWRPEAWPSERLDTRLTRRLLALEAAFPEAWRRQQIDDGIGHPIVSDLSWRYSRLRLLALADELRPNANARTGGASVWMAGKLHDRRQYAPTASEFLVGPLVRMLGPVRSQPQANRLGCDYLVERVNENLGVEVKSLRKSWRVERQQTSFVQANPEYSGVLPPRDEAYEAQRLYRRVRHAATQLRATALSVSATKPFAGIVILDLAGDSLLTNLWERIHGWMDLDWARWIDMLLFIDHDAQTGGWGTIVIPVCHRGDAIWDFLVDQLGPACQNRHFHLGYVPSTKTCDYPWM